MEYAILAFSYSKNETQRELNLENNPRVTDQAYAQKIAESFAMRLNQNQFLNATDWVARIELINDPVPQPGFRG